MADRGFRDIVQEMDQEHSLKVKIPACVPPSQKQLTCKEANMSRIVTKGSLGCGSN